MDDLHAALGMLHVPPPCTLDASSPGSQGMMTWQQWFRFSHPVSFFSPSEVGTMSEIGHHH